MQFASDPTRPVSVSPSFTLSMYMLFVGHGAKIKPAGENKGPAEPATPQRAGHDVAAKMRTSSHMAWKKAIESSIWQEDYPQSTSAIVPNTLHWTFDRSRGYTPDIQAFASSVGQSANDGRPDEYSYHLEIIEDLDDGQVHEEHGVGYTVHLTTFRRQEFASLFPCIRYQRSSIPTLEGS